MMNNMASVKKVVEGAIARLARAEHFQSGSIISMPVLYPGGDSVLIEVMPQGEYFRISDRGTAYREADLLGASRLFHKEIERIKHESGINFDGRDVYLSKISIDCVSAAITIVAHYSQQILHTCYVRAADKARQNANEFLYDKLQRLFPQNKIQKDVELLGRSNHQWQVSALVTTNDNSIVFDTVASHPTSAVWTAAKFDDLSRLEHAPQRVAVISAGLGDMIGVVSNNATAVIEDKAGDEDYKRLLRAA